MTDKRVEAMSRAASNAVHDKKWDEFKIISPFTAALETKRIEAAIAADPVTEDVKVLLAGFGKAVEVMNDYAVHLHIRGGSLQPIPEIVEANKIHKKWSGE